MDNSPKISIITPTYNAQKFINKSIQSVLDQTYANYEHIVVDGNSTDGTVSILKSYPHLKWISERDAGIYDAMNKGVKLASGDWIYFLGADDKLYNSAVLQTISEKLIDTLDFVYGNVWRAKTKSIYDGEFTKNKILIRNICHQAIFYKRSSFNEIGYFNLNYSVLADWEYNWRCFFNKKINVKYLPITVATYSDGGISTMLKDEKFQADKYKLMISYAASYIPLDQRKNILRGIAYSERIKRNYFSSFRFYLRWLLNSIGIKS
jgi:glycosyltransferase involved in cell wall biosynthesis